MRGCILGLIVRSRAKTERLNGLQDLYLENQGQNLAWIVLCVPCSLDSGAETGCRDREKCKASDAEKEEKTVSRGVGVESGNISDEGRDGPYTPDLFGVDRS